MLTPRAGQPYRGRFAPSPTGPLHFGSLLAALASYLDARHQRGQWLLRMEDLDRPRIQAGAADAILRTLEAHGLTWDGPVLWQSTRDAAYAQALARLATQDLLFYCTCSRNDLAAHQRYPGTCRPRRTPPSAPHAVRIQVPPLEVTVQDAIQGHYLQQLARDCGDFVVQRRDGLFAYQLAVVVDDAAQGISHVVRGADLLESAPRQHWLATRLGLPPMHYAHIPVLADAQGQKLSKQWLAPALSNEQASANLYTALNLLGQTLPTDAWGAPVSVLLDWACSHWQLSAVPKGHQLTHYLGIS